MKNISIIANSYLAKTLTYDIEYLLGCNVKNVFLLKENHTTLEFIDNHSKINFILCDNIEYMIAQSDLVLFFKNSFSPDTLIKRIDFMSCNNPEKFIVVEESEVALTDIDINIIDDMNMPMILLISYSKFTQQLCTEIMLNKNFNDLNIRIKQDFSKESETLISSLYKNNIINKNIINDRKRELEDCDVLIKSISADIFGSIDKNLWLLNYITKAKPDYIIINTNYKVNINKDNLLFFMHRYGYEINTIIYSEFVPIITNDVNSISVYIGQQNKKIQSLHKMQLLKNDIVSDILSKISLPSGVEIIK